MSLCPGCRAELPEIDGPVHRYIEASPACWAAYGRLQAGEPPLAPFWTQALIADAYAAQHPGVPSPQAIQSVAVHLVTLEAVLGERREPSEAVWIRTRAVERSRAGAVSFGWLEPRPEVWRETLADVIAGETPHDRAVIADRWVRAVLEGWREQHAETITAWTDAVLGGG